MLASPLAGIVTALVTPFHEDERIDFDSWQRIIDAQIAAGIDGLLVTGGQGEFFSLSDDERVAAWHFCRQYLAGRIPVYANVGCPSTRQTIQLAQRAADEGVECLVVITPYYLRPSADELVDHYMHVCRAVRVPVLGYNIPERTGVDLTPAMVRRIAGACENFAGLKDSSGNLDRIPELADHGPRPPLRAFHRPRSPDPARPGAWRDGRHDRLRECRPAPVCGSVTRLSRR